MIERLDLWLGKNLFQPPIIRLCQLTGMTQYAVHRYIWWAITMFCIWRINSDDHWLWKTVVIIMGLCQTFSAGLAPDVPTEGSDRLRRFMIMMAGVEMLFAAMLMRVPSPMLIAMLFAEYALTIKTIPPRETKKAVGKARQANI